MKMYCVYGHGKETEVRARPAHQATMLNVLFSRDRTGITEQNMNTTTFKLMPLTPSALIQKTKVV